MRFQDWDCLLFSDGADSARNGLVPLQEFRVACHAVQEGRGTHYSAIASRGDGLRRNDDITPLLTCFVPSQTPDSYFHISLHRWAYSGRYEMPWSNNIAVHRVWRIQVYIDGVPVVDDLLSASTEWPHTTTRSNFPVMNAHGEFARLRWPQFDRHVATARSFSPVDELGCIKVGLSAGYANRTLAMSSFTATSKIVTFSFVHAPLDLLKRCGIAWPNPAMFKNPLHGETPPSIVPVLFDSEYHTPVAHKQINSFSSPSSIIPDAPPPTPLSMTSDNAYQQPSEMENQLCHAKLRSSSSKHASRPSWQTPTSIINGLMGTTNTHVGQLSPTTTGAMSSPRPMSAQPASEMMRKDSKSMPPPGYPASTMGNSKHAIKALATPTRKSSGGYDVLDSVEALPHRRESHGSDVSMHMTCLHFPACTTEDEHGHLKHESPIVPLTAIRVKRENLNASSDI